MSESSLLACDVGLKRIGLALYVGGVVLPLEPIIRLNRRQASQDLQSLLEVRKPQKLLVGLPHARYADTRKRVLHFVSLLDFTPMVYVDEESSSTQALEHTAHLARMKRQQARKNGVLDSLSACVILERYLQGT
ncbi:Holliday junction resolvase RuvX [Helicobacter salomonis]|uniref:Holliday junction resolvase RuvX n=1 Tax=Helicobacter salomonis TaxID=56878 RepID=UPI001F02B4E6|nr:Holliday junction resolvase RuvX [Helicobacter salomonis]